MRGKAFDKSEFWKNKHKLFMATTSSIVRTFKDSDLSTIKSSRRTAQPCFFLSCSVLPLSLDLPFDVEDSFKCAALVVDTASTPDSLSLWIISRKFWRASLISEFFFDSAETVGSTSSFSPFKTAMLSRLDFEIALKSATTANKIRSIMWSVCVWD